MKKGVYVPSERRQPRRTRKGTLLLHFQLFPIFSLSPLRACKSDFSPCLKVSYNVSELLSFWGTVMRAWAAFFGAQNQLYRRRAGSTLSNEKPYLNCFCYADIISKLELEDARSPSGWGEVQGPFFSFGFRPRKSARCLLGSSKLLIRLLRVSKPKQNPKDEECQQIFTF